MPHARRNDMAHAVATLQIGDHHRATPHQRQESGSTVDSTVNGSPYDSPFTQNISNLHIVGTDPSPSPYYPFDDFGNPTQLSCDVFPTYTTTYKPSVLSHSSAQASVMMDMRHIIDNDSARNIYDPLSAGPSSDGADEMDKKLFKIPSNEYRQSSHQGLYRTESAACQDELYNPADFDQPMLNSSSQQLAPLDNGKSNGNADHLPPHRTLVSDIVRTANNVRSQSPAQLAPLRNSSPFRHGSPLAPSEQFRRNRGPILNTVAAVRQQQKARQAAIEFAAHQPPLKREEPRTISPKDAMLDYNEPDRDNSTMSLFADNVTDDYRSHLNTNNNNPLSSDIFGNNYLSSLGQYMPVNHAQLSNFRPVDGSVMGSPGIPTPRPSVSSVSSQPLPQTHARTQSSRSFNSQPVSRLNEQPPDFPAHLPSMESSISENTFSSSQENPAKRARLSENDSRRLSARLTDSHASPTSTRSVAKISISPKLAPTSSIPATAASADEHDDDDDDDEYDADSQIGRKMSSSAILARNSQAGPHKCARINPSTGQPCNTIFSRPYDLTRHEDTIHNRVKRKVACEYCTELKTFSRSDALTRHMRVVHPEVEYNAKRAMRAF